MDVTTIVNALLEFAGSCVLGLVGLAVTQITTKVKRWFDKRTVQDAVQTAAGGLMLKLASGAMHLGDVTTGHPTVVLAADAAMGRVGEAASNLGGVTPESMAALVVGAVGRALASDPTVPTIASTVATSTPTIPTPPKPTGFASPFADVAHNF